MEERERGAVQKKTEIARIVKRNFFFWRGGGFSGAHILNCLTGKTLLCLIAFTESTFSEFFFSINSPFFFFFFFFFFLFKVLITYSVPNLTQTLEARFGGGPPPVISN